jgi:phosphoglycerate kinase
MLARFKTHIADDIIRLASIMLIRKRSVEEVDVSGKRIFLRTDLNVPLAAGKVADDERIIASVPTLRHLLERNCRVVVSSHLGRPKGKPDLTLSLRPVAARLSELLGRPVPLAPDCVGPEADSRAAALAEGECLLLENLRFHPEEEKNDASFARSLAGRAEVYVNDAFGASHRRHASVAAITEHLKLAVAGLLMGREIEALSRVLLDPPKPYAAVLGGAKVTDKVPLIDALLLKVDRLMVGGAMAYSFLAARGVSTGSSSLDPATVEAAGKILKRATELNVSLHLPVDHRVVLLTGVGGVTNDTLSESIDLGWVGVDIGPRTERAFSEVLRGCRCILWNGPLGWFEKGYAHGTRAVAEAAVSAGAFTVAGGGDTAAVLNELEIADRFSHLSTGGGACLEFLSGKTLPGLQCLNDA